VGSRKSNWILLTRFLCLDWEGVLRSGRGHEWRELRVSNLILDNMLRSALARRRFFDGRRKKEPIRPSVRRQAGSVGRPWASGKLKRVGRMMTTSRAASGCGRPSRSRRAMPALTVIAKPADGKRDLKVVMRPKSHSRRAVP